MSKIDTTFQFIRDKAEAFGAKMDTGSNKPYLERNNTSSDALNDNGAYFGFIHPDEDASGPFHDFSFTIFPSADDKPWLICLGIGSLGFRHDYELATYPGLKRLFSKLVNEKGNCKSDFSDIETNLPKAIINHADLAHIKNTIKKYSKVLPACQIVDDPESSEGKQVLEAFLAGYAKVRDWPSNNAHRNAVSAALEPYLKSDTIDDVNEVHNLLLERRFLVIEGPPGTGKTRTAKAVAAKMNARTFFTQFHAETSYSDFIYGLRPDIESGSLRYIEKQGSFAEALHYAIDHSNENVLLMIDEINRANLSNVLGPIFYLFEYQMDITDVEIEITPQLKIQKLPDNFYAIATMNTADRSLAVVDFALRRRFAWYPLRPKPIEDRQPPIQQSPVFFKEDFLKIGEIFDWYATSRELSLQPGQGYFLAKDEAAMKDRIRYEIYPLIREYLQEGLLQGAREEFENYFSTRISTSLFE